MARSWGKQWRAAVYAALALMSPLSAEVLEPESVAQADPATLLEDAALFNEIGKGIALSIAKCEGQSPCVAIVSAYEMEQMVRMLDERIESVTAHRESTGEDLTMVMTAYADVKARYANYLDQFSQILVYEPAPPVGDEYDIFLDSEDILEDEGDFEFDEPLLEDDEGGGDDF